MPRPTVARVAHGAFQHEESFRSKLDADHWRTMVEETLEKPASRQLDLHEYARGLAASVRRYGGPQTREAWLRGDAPANMWARGRVFGMKGLKDQIQDVLAGRPVE